MITEEEYERFTLLVWELVNEHEADGKIVAGYLKDCLDDIIESLESEDKE